MPAASCLLDWLEAPPAAHAAPWSAFRTDVLPLASSTIEVAISPLAPKPPELDEPRVRDAWQRLCIANPRFFDGGLLAVKHIEAEADATRIHARRDRFARLAVQPGVPTGVRLLSVTAVLVARDDAGKPHLLLGKRSAQTRIYGDQWELGPSGGVPPPHAGVRTLDERALMDHLADEVEEEAGLRVREGRAVAITRDHAACSDDVVFVCDVGELAMARASAKAANWEYTQVAWIPAAELRTFVAREAANVIGPTRALVG